MLTFIELFLNLFLPVVVIPDPHTVGGAFDVDTYLLKISVLII
jgi:hypothetical protein